MKFRVCHVTEYVYRDTVPLCHNLVHLHPRDTALQSCEGHELAIDPAPATLRGGRDFFGNPVAWFSLQEPHRKMTITASSLVEVTPRPPGPVPSRAWETAVRSTATAATPDPHAGDEVAAFVYESPYVPVSPKLADYARPSFAPGRPLAEAAADLMRRVNTEFRFVPGATNVGTPVLDVLRDRRGVCQDFSHLMIGCLRSIGLSARYVSGYLLTRPPPGKPRLVGADASHAWVSVYVPGHGWMDLDPTNDCLPDDKHVTLGWARDYGDIGPVQGVIVGGRQHALSVSVDVEPLEAD